MVEESKEGGARALQLVHQRLRRDGEARLLQQVIELVEVVDAAHAQPLVSAAVCSGGH